jgi:hypothetical protein
VKLQLAVTALLASALLAGGSGANANAASDDNTATPILITALKIDPNVGPFDNFAYPGLITVSFVITQPKTVDEVVFGLRDFYGQLVYQYRDVGPFAANAVLRNHSFVDTQVGDGQTLQVDLVKFDDGSTWYPTPLVRRQATAAVLPERTSR